MAFNIMYFDVNRRSETLKYKQPMDCEVSHQRLGDF